jgi:hypothetical protein
VDRRQPDATRLYSVVVLARVMREERREVRVERRGTSVCEISSRHASTRYGEDGV